jgi:hypothetical protein
MGFHRASIRKRPRNPGKLAGSDPRRACETK